MRIRLRQVVFVLGVVLLSGCAASPATSTTSATSTAQGSPAEETVSPAKARLATESPSPTPAAPNATSSTGPAQRTAVIWGDYDSGLQSSIDDATSVGDCQGISTYFGMTTATEDAVKARTGHGNEAVVAYLNESLAIAKCS